MKLNWVLKRLTTIVIMNISQNLPMLRKKLFHKDDRFFKIFTKGFKDEMNLNGHQKKKDNKECRHVIEFLLF